MKLNNIRILSKDELFELSKSYSFKVVDNNVIVTTERFQNGFVHSIDGFSLNMPKFKTKIKFTKIAIDLWRNDLKQFNLFYVQNAVNVLLLLKQKVTLANVKSILARDSLKIKLI